MRRWLWCAASLALLAPVSLLGQAVTRPDMIGTWRSTKIKNVRGDSVVGKSLLILRADSTFSGGDLVPDMGKWSLAGDTLVNVRVVPNPAGGEITWIARYQLSRAGDTLTMVVLEVTERRIENGRDKTYVLSGTDGAFPNVYYQFERVDTTKPQP